MKLRSRRIRREFLCIGMAFLLVILMPHTQLKPISMPVVQAQGDDVVMTASDLQFDGSRYYYIVNMYVTNLNWTWQVFLNNNVEQIVTDTPLISYSIDTSIFVEDIPGCFGIQSCDQYCNNCVRAGNRDCLIAAIAEQVVGEITVGTACILCISSLSWTGIGILACVVACAAVLAVLTAGVLARFRTCKAAVPGNCTNPNPGCTCRAIAA